MLCLPKSIADKLTTALKSGELTFDRLYEMKDSADRATLLAHYVGDASSHMVNTVFEKAMVDADKQAQADYVDVKDKANFAKVATGGKFAEKLLNPEETKKLAVSKIDANIDAVKTRQENIKEKIAAETDAGKKANLEYKLNKYREQEARLNVRKEDALNPAKDRMLAKIQSIKGLLSPEDEKAHYEDLASMKLGQDVTPAQGKYIVDQASKLQELKAANKDAILGVSPEYLKTRSNLENFIGSMNPDHAAVSILKNLVEIARNNIITSVSTPLKTFVGGETNNIAGQLIRRISSLSARGDNAALAKEIFKANRDMFWKTGTNTAAMESIDDVGSILGSHAARGGIGTKESFAPPAEVPGGKGVLGAVNKVVGWVAGKSHDVAITLEHNIIFTKLYSSAFSDLLNFRASAMASVEGLKGAEKVARAAELMRDAAKIEPETEAGTMLRKAAQAGASKVLNANDTWASRASVGIKNVLNTMGNKVGIPVGDLLEPIAKIPANLYANALNTTAIGMPDAFREMVKGKMDMGMKNDMETRYQGALQFKSGYEKAIGIVGSFALASLITQGLTSKDFRTDTYGNSFVKFGDWWVNMEYFSRLSPNVAGIMAAKNYNASSGKKSFTGEISHYLVGSGKAGEGAIGGILHIPGFDVFNTTAQAIATGNTSTFKTNVQNRVMPAGLADMFKTRPINRLFFGASGLESTAQVKADNEAKAQKAAATRAANARAKANGG